MITEAEHAKKYKPLDHQFLLGALWGFKVVGRVIRDFFHDRKEIERQIISPVGDQIGDSKSLPSGEVAAGLQIKQAILELPEKIERFSRNIEKEKQNLAEYLNQLNTKFPYKEELETKKERLHEIDNLIIQKAKEVDEAKKQMKEENIEIIPLSSDQKQYNKDNPNYFPPHYGMPPITDEQANSIPDSIAGNKIARHKTVDNKKQINSGVDPDANGLYNHDGDDFTDELIEFFEQKPAGVKVGQTSELKEPGDDLKEGMQENGNSKNDFFTQSDRRNDEVKGGDEKEYTPKRLGRK